MSNQVMLVQVDDKTLSFQGNTYPVKDRIRVIGGAQWDKGKKYWKAPMESLPEILRLFPSILMEEKLKKGYQEHQERMKAVKKIKEMESAEVSIKGLKANLYPYQAVGVQFMDTMKEGEGIILAYDMGLGKSLTALAKVTEWLNQGVIDHCLVVCPSPLKYATWKKEIEKWTDLSYIVVDGSKPVTVEWEDGTTSKLKGRELREVQYQQWLPDVADTKITVMNYELFRDDYVTQAWVKGRELTDEESEELELIYAEVCDELFNGEWTKDAFPVAVDRYVAKYLTGEKHYTIRNPKNPTLYVMETLPSILPSVNHRWCVILDECHRIRNPKAQTTKNLRNALKGAGRKILATGTPLENNLEELWATVDFCRPGMLGNFFKFKQRYIMQDAYGKSIAPNAVMMDDLMERLDIVMLRKTKAEALPYLPKLTVQDYWVEMTKTQKALYKEVVNGILETLNEQGEKSFSYMDVLAQITRLQQVCDSPALLRELTGDDTLPEESGKLKELESIIEDINPQKNKFVLFSQYRTMTDILYNWLIDKGILRPEQIGYVKGGLNPAETERIQNDFQNGQIQCVLMTTAGNYGLDLSSGSYVICYDQLFNPQKMEQIYARCHRNGAENAITAINLVTKDSYEVRKMEILQEKRELFKAIIDNDEDMMAKLFNRGSLKEALMDMIA